MKAINSIIYMILAGVLAIVTACNETAVMHPDLFLEEEHLYFEVSEYGAADILGNGAIITFPVEGGQKELIISSNCYWSCSLSGIPYWTEIDGEFHGEGDGKIILTAQANTDSAPREFELNIQIYKNYYMSTRTLRIVQDGSAPYLATNFENESKLLFSAGVQTETYTISTNVSLDDIVVDNNNDWINVGFTDGKLSVSVQENVSTESRTSTLVSMKYSSETLLSFIVQQDGYSATGDGTEANPYNIAKALSLARALDSSGKITGVYVKGRITSIVEVSTSYGNATYYIADNTGGEEFYVYRGYWFNGDKFTSEDQIKTGGEVVVFGDLVNYGGNTPEFTSGNYLISYNGRNDGLTSEPATGSYTIKMLSQELTQIPSDWTIDDVFLSSEISYVWSWHMYNEAGYLNASAYMNGTPHTATAYAISPEIDLTNATEASFSFEHAAKFQTTLRTLCGLVVREVGTTVWNDLTIPVWPEAGLWAFVNSGEISLERYLGKRIQIAFKYGSSSDGADTWQIRNLVIKTVSNGMGLGGYGDDQDITIKANKR